MIRIRPGDLVTYSASVERQDEFNGVGLVLSIHTIEPFFIEPRINVLWSVERRWRQRLCSYPENQLMVINAWWLTAGTRADP